MQDQLNDFHPLVVFKSSSIHGTGGFARVDIHRRKRIIEYIGLKISKAQSQTELSNQNFYIFHLNDKYDLDGSVNWNPARFLNHSCQPNCEAGIRQGRIWLYALRNIRAGEELTYNYNYEPEEGDPECLCKCGSPECFGYMDQK